MFLILYFSYCLPPSLSVGFLGLYVVLISGYTFAILSLSDISIFQKLNHQRPVAIFQVVENSLQRWRAFSCSWTRLAFFCKGVTHSNGVCTASRIQIGQQNKLCLFFGGGRGQVQYLTLYLRRNISACPTALNSNYLTEVECPWIIFEFISYFLLHIYVIIQFRRMLPPAHLVHSA